ERVPEQVNSAAAGSGRLWAGVAGAEPVRDQGHVRGQRGQLVRVSVVTAGGLELAAHVDRDYLPAGRGQRLQDEQEVLFAPGIAGYQQRGPPFTDPGDGYGFVGR